MGWSAEIRERGFLVAGVLCWAAGYYLAIPPWFILIVVVLCVLQRVKADDVQRRRVAIELQNAMSDAKVAHTILGDDMPPWVSFPPVERSAWLNMLFQQLWPSVVEAMQGTLKQSLNPLLESYMPSFLTKFQLTDCSLGSVPIRILGVQGLTETGDSTVIDLKVAWAGTPNIRLTAGVKLVEVDVHISEFSLKGHLRMTLGPHCRSWPCFGALSFSFIGNPSVDYKLSALKLPLDAIPGLANFIDGFIRESLFHFMVFPKRYSYVIVEDAASAMTAQAIPTATIICIVHGAEGLPKRFLQSCDTHVVGSVSSNPKDSTTPTVKDNVNPSYGDKRMTFTIHGTPDERLAFSVEERLGTIGKVELFTTRLSKNKGTVRQKYRIVGSDPAKNVGKLDVSIEVAPLVPYHTLPQESLDVNALGSTARPGVLLIHVISCARLSQIAFFGALSSVFKVGRSSSNYYVKCSVGRIFVRSWATSHTRDPTYNWHDHIDFRDVRTDEMVLEVCTQELAVDHVVGVARIHLADVAASQGKLRTTVQLDPEGEVTLELGILMRVAGTSDVGSAAFKQA